MFVYQSSFSQLIFTFSPIRHVDDSHLSAGELFKKDLHSSLLSYLPVFSTSRSDVPLLTSALFTPSIHLFLGRPTEPPKSSILITCPYHLNLFLSISFSNGVTCSSSLMLALRILSLIKVIKQSESVYTSLPTLLQHHFHNEDWVRGTSSWSKPLLAII